jgi:hypothetical protein
MMVDTWSEIKGIQSAVYEALDREDKAEQLEKEAFEAWKKGGVLAAADEGLKEHQKNNEQRILQKVRASNGPYFFTACKMARSSGPELQGASGRLQVSSRKLDTLEL